MPPQQQVLEAGKKKAHKAYARAQGNDRRIGTVVLWLICLPYEVSGGMKGWG